jgi:hypothetical protein
MANRMMLWYPPAYGFVNPFFGGSAFPEYVTYIQEVNFRPKIFGPYGPYTYGVY